MSEKGLRDFKYKQIALWVVAEGIRHLLDDFVPFLEEFLGSACIYFSPLFIARWCFEALNSSLAWPHVDTVSWCAINVAHFTNFNQIILYLYLLK